MQCVQGPTVIAPTSYGLPLSSYNSTSYSILSSWCYMANVIFADHRGIDCNALSAYVIPDRGVENTENITLCTSRFLSIFSRLRSPSERMKAECGSSSNSCLSFLTLQSWMKTETLSNEYNFRQKYKLVKIIFNAWRSFLMSYILIES